MKPQSYKMNCRQLRSAASRRRGLPQGRVHQLAVSYLTVNPENVHTSNTQTEWIVFENTHTGMDVCMHPITISKKRRRWA